MCGIFGYKGVQHSAERVLLHGLERLEYRGYDSAGMVVVEADGTAQSRKAVGAVTNLSTKVEHAKKGLTDRAYAYGIAHTRRATHGGVTEENCHPHWSNNGKVYIVHNGIIENYLKLKKMLEGKGYTFYSETDTEVISNLIQYYYEGNFLQAVERTIRELRGAYAILVIHQDHPDEIIGARLGSPLLLAYNDAGDFYFSSDAQALAGYAEKIVYLEEGDIVHIKSHDFLITSGGKPTLRPVEELNQQELAVSKGDYKHFMLKEIYEQPNIVRRIYKGRANFNDYKLTADAFHGMQEERYQDMIFVACGTSYHAGLLASYRMEELVGISTRVEVASEYENKPIRVRDNLLHVFISQSGETADSIECLKLIKEQGGQTFGVVNVPGSTIARMTNNGLFTRAGTEIGVASTKAFTAQSVCLMLTALFMAKKRGLRYAVYKDIMHELEQLPMLMETILDQSEYIRSVAQQLTEFQHCFYLGRHYQLPIAHEAALKLKEISYIHAQAYPAGELKHGTLALIDEQTPTILLMPNDLMFEKNMSTLQEIKARNGKVLVISDKKVPGADRQIMIPESIPEVYPLLTNIAAQLLAYHVADLLNRNIDKPRNLAKSVTVK